MGATMEEEMVSAVNLLVAAYEKLKKIDPQHELLRFIRKITPEKISFTKDETLAKEFDERFPPTNPNNTETIHQIYSYIRYERAITEATGNAKGSKQ